MDSVIRFVTDYYWLFIILTAFFVIVFLGFYVEERKDKADEMGEKLDDKLIEEAEEKLKNEREGYNA